jgi:transposase, IS5 family
MSLGRKNLQAVLGPTPEDLVRRDHPYRRLLVLVEFEELCAPLGARYSKMGRAGYPVDAIFKALLLQWMEGLSDRELERFLEENVAAKLFCGFGLLAPTPDFSTFSLARARIGAEGLAQLFNAVRESLRSAGLVREVFTFVDATQLITKVNLWNERDKAIKAGQEKLRNETIGKFAADKDARLGKKGSTKWFGYKLHAGVDMSHGLITKVAATAANVEDTRAARHVMPAKGMVFGDKAYGVGDSAREMRRRGLHSGAILKNDMVRKNPDKDRWLCSVRMPYESTFARFEKRARYRGLAKCQFQAFMQAFAHNFKRLLAIDAPPLILRPQCA